MYLLKILIYIFTYPIFVYDLLNLNTKRMKRLLLVLLSISAGTFLFTAQKTQDKPEKWNRSLMQTGLYDQSVISSTRLPQVIDNYDQVTVTRYINDPNGVYAVNPNVRVLPRSNSYQSEVIICRNPVNPLIMFGSSNAINNAGGSLFISEGVYVTTNGGLNWFGSDTLTGSPIGNHGGDPGPTIDKNGTIIMTHLGYTVSGMFANYSTNNGATWSSTYTIVSGSQDKNFASTDDAVSSPYYGRSYVVWSRFTAASPPVAVSYTTNGGVSWSAGTDINVSAASHYSQGCDLRVGPNGEVYVVWAAPVLGSPYTEDFAGFAKSTNGGVNWSVTNNAYDMNGIRGTFTAKSGIRTNGFPRIDVDRSGGVRNGWIYTVASESNLAPAGSDPDIILHKSTNGGVTWSGGIRVNQDALNNGKYQWFPAVRVDENGGLNIVYYDDRNTASDSGEVYMSRSLDGGTTFTDVLVSDHRFKPKALGLSGVAGGYQGDYIGITSGNGKVWPMWMDDKSGIYQAWTTSVDIGPSITHTPLQNTEQITGNYNVNCSITASNSGIDPSKTKMLWSRNNPALTDSLLMTNTSGSNWTAAIPANGTGAVYRYYIKTSDSLGRISVSPAGAPVTLNIFTAAIDTAKPVITHTPISDQSKPSWPVNVSAKVTDNFTLDSVWVKWYKNTVINTKSLKLTNSGGSNYSSLFNSLNSDVIIGDIIYYRIYAQDNSNAHNRDSTSLYAFNITDQKLCEGFSAVKFPPVFWDIEFTDVSYWMRNDVSSYGAGNGSAMFNFWNSYYGTQQSLVSLTFSNSLLGDSLSFDNAYAPYSFGTDSLIIENSTDEGLTYNILVSLWGNSKGGPLVTAPVSAVEFFPSNSQWITQKYALPVGTNKIRFRAVSDYGNNLFLDSICAKNFFPAPIIVHTPLQNTEQLSGNFPVNCVIYPYSSAIDPAKTKLFWSRNDPSITDSVLMTHSGGYNWTANIPGNGLRSTYRYYLRSADSLNRATSSPYNAPEELYLFEAALDTTRPLISYTPLGDQIKPSWPVSVSATVTDDFGLDSVWVKWYKNSVSNTKLFRLDNIGVDDFSSMFNSLNSDVISGDIIYYKIYAQDNSIAHNRDSSVLNLFNVIDLDLGEGFTSKVFPPIYWDLEFSKSSYWFWDYTSSYGTGYGCSVFSNWYAPPGTIQSLVTLTFSKSIPGDSLSFDNAYAPNLKGTDSLIIESSTNEGITYTTLVSLWGNAKGGPLVTAPAVDYEYYPDYYDWTTQKYPLPIGTDKIKFRAVSDAGNDLFLDSIIIVNNSVKPFNITVIPEGLYNLSTNRLNARDTIRAFLSDVGKPDIIIDSGKFVIDSLNFKGYVLFSKAPSGNYYIHLKHRNALETWSREGGIDYVKGVTYNYNFTTSSSQAYGSNEVLKGTKYCLYSGDITDFDIIDLNDLVPVYNDLRNYVTGYKNTDLTGDRFVDLADLLVIYQNSSGFVRRKAPPGVSPFSKDTGIRRQVKIIVPEEIRETEKEEPVTIIRKNIKN